MNRVEYRNGEPIIILDGSNFGLDGEYRFIARKNDKFIDFKSRYVDFDNYELVQKRKLGLFENTDHSSWDGDITVVTNEKGKVLWICNNLLDEDNQYAYVNEDGTLSDWIFASEHKEGLICYNINPKIHDVDIRLKNGKILKNVIAEFENYESPLIIKYNSSDEYSYHVADSELQKFTNLIVFDEDWQDVLPYNAIIKLQKEGGIHLYNTHDQTKSDGFDEISILDANGKKISFNRNTFDKNIFEAYYLRDSEEFKEVDSLCYFLCSDKFFGTKMVDIAGVETSSNEIQPLLDLINFKTSDNIDFEFRRLSKVLSDIDYKNYADEKSFKYIKSLVANICRNWVEFSNPIKYQYIIEKAKELNLQLEDLHTNSIKKTDKLEVEKEIDNIFGV